ncbi:protein phosphatase 1 regulatory subunit 42 [bacterium]|nr:protein phosphatase 1 regulatory subunit 42 [bacterium]
MAQEIIRIETINTNIVNVATTEVIKIEGVGLQGNSGDNVGVLSFNGRIGIVSPELDDYQASLVDNDSSVVGDTVKDALDTIQTDLDGLPSTFVTSFDGRTGAITPALDDYQASLITNNSTETGATVKDALDALDIEQGTQDTAIALNTAKRSYPLADENRLAGTSGTNTGDQDLSGIATNASDIDDLEAEQILQNDAITAIEDTAVFESPVSPNPVNYIWLGTDIDYQAIIAPQDDTIYNINNNLETKVALWFKTQNVSPITPTITGAVADWKSAGSDEGNDLGVSNPTFTYTDSSVEHLVTATAFDLLNVTQIDFRQDGLQSIADLSVLTSLTYLHLANNQLTDIGDLSTLTSLSNLSLYNNQLTDIGDLSGLTSLSILYLYTNQLTDIGGIGSASLTTVRLENNALIQACVDQVFNDVDSLGASNGSLNVSGGTNHYPTLFSKPAIDSLTAKGWTITANTDPNPLSFITSGVSPITPTITGTVADWSSDGSTEGTVLGSSAPTFNYADTGQDYLVEVGNFDPLNVTSIDSNADGLTRIFLQSMPNVKSFKVQNNNSLEYVYGLETLTGIDAELFLYGCDLEGNVTLPNAPNLEIISFRSNPRLTKLNNLDMLVGLVTSISAYDCDITGHQSLPLAPMLLDIRLYNNINLSSVSSLLGLTSCSNIEFQNCALDQTTVDMIFNDTDANGVSNGSINVSGGTNSAPSVASDTARTNLIAKGWTLTFN